MMNVDRMERATRTISERQKALAWLTEYGVKINGNRDEIAACVTLRIHLDFAGSCDGANEAKKVMESYALLLLPDAIQNAIACCNNDIGMALSDLLEEVGK